MSRSPVPNYRSGDVLDVLVRRRVLPLDEAVGLLPDLVLPPAAEPEPAASAVVRHPILAVPVGPGHAPEVRVARGVGEDLSVGIKERIHAGIDDWVLEPQYGFRRRKSTAHAIFLARRLIDRAAKVGQNLSMILLDWEKSL